MSHTNCCVVNCFNTYANCPPGTKFFRFSQRVCLHDQRAQWIRSVRRVNADGTQWQPAKWSRICSAHFVGGKPSTNPWSPSYAPTIFPPAHRKKTAGAEDRELRYQRLPAGISCAAALSAVTGDVMPVSTNGAHSPEVSCSQATQATISTVDTGTQCAPVFTNTRESQTEAVFPEPVVDDPFMRVPTPPDDLGRPAKAALGQQGNRTSSYSSRFTNTGKTVNGQEGIHVGVDLYGIQSRQRTHHQEVTLTSAKPDICEVCNKHFWRKGSLHKHMRSHTGEKPFVCRVCPKSFGRKWRMKIMRNCMQAQCPTDVVPV